MTPIDFARVFESTPNPYMLLDRELRYVAANAAYRRVTGHEQRELVGRHVFEAFPNDPSDPNNDNTLVLRRSFERVLATGKSDVLPVITYRVPEVMEDGRTVSVERVWSATHTPILADDGSVLFVLQHTVDITELHRLQQSLHGSERDRARPSADEAGVLGRAQLAEERSRSLDAEREHLVSLFQQAPGFMAFLRGKDHVFELANASYMQLIGHREVVGKTVREGLPEIVGQGFIELLDGAFASKKPFVGHGLLALLQRTPGAPLDERYIDVVYQPIVDDGGTVTGIFVQGHDITEQKRLEDERIQLLDRERAARAEAERANRLKDEFLATVSHELRTPLTAMLGWASMLKRGHLQPEQMTRAIDTIERNARAQAQLVADLLDVSRIMSGKMELHTELLEVAAIAAAALESIRPAADAKNIHLASHFDAEARVVGDAGRLQQVVWNLLSNAVKFTPPDGAIEVRVRVLAGSVELTVIDSGVGIDPQFLPYVFERFRQAEGSSARTYGGLGLGLAIVKHLVELHGGTVHAASEGPGRGAAVSIRLPIAARRSPTTPLPAPPRPNGELHGASTVARLKLLVVDDDADGRDFVKLVLEGCGATVESAGSSIEGVEKLRVFRPDIVISDIGMPEEDGYAFLRRVRALTDAEGGRTPAIALTAFARAEDRTRALLAGFRAHVPKPVDSGELVAVIASIAGS